MRTFRSFSLLLPSLALLPAPFLLACTEELDGFAEVEREDFSVSCAPGVANPNIHTVVDFDAHFLCEEDPTLCGPEDFTDRFIAATAGWATPPASCEEHIDGIITMWDNATNGAPLPTSPNALSTEQLRERVIEGLNLGHLMDRLPGQALTVTIVSERETPTFREQELFFTDPLVGSFQGILLSPLGPGPFPVVLQLPGHHENAPYHRDVRYGNESPERGIATLILSIRAYDAGAAEDAASRDILCAGFSMQTIRLYEAMVALRYLDSREDMCLDRRGFMGHSGGAVALNGLMRVVTDAMAFVSDFDSYYLGVGTYENGGRHLTDENAPGLIPFRHHIADRPSFQMPLLATTYGWCVACNDGDPHPEEVPEYVFDFLQEHMRPEDG